jgi:hypothetical protein
MERQFKNRDQVRLKNEYAKIKRREKKRSIQPVIMKQEENKTEEIKNDDLNVFDFNLENYIKALFLEYECEEGRKLA